MASCKLGHVYIVSTVLTKPPKAKFAICISPENSYFIWINSRPRPHGKDQMSLAADCHELIEHDSVLDLSRIVMHPAHELEDAREFGRISSEVAKDILDCIDAGLFLMPANHAAMVRAAVFALL